MNLFDQLVLQAMRNQDELAPLRAVVEKELLHHDIIREMGTAGFLNSFRCCGPFHLLQNPRAAVLKRNIQVRQNPGISHHGNYLIDMWVGVDIVQAHPDTETAKCVAQFFHARPDWPSTPEIQFVFHVNAVGRGILGNDQQIQLPEPEAIYSRCGPGHRRWRSCKYAAVGGSCQWA